MEELVYILEPGGCVAYVNPACERALGYTNAEILGRNAEDFVAPEDLGRYRAAARRVRAGETVRDFEAVLLARSGARIVCRGKTRPHMEDGVYAGALIICTDVTAERRAEVTRARLARTLDVSSDFVAMMTADGQPVYVNRAGRRMLGVPDDADLGTITPESCHPLEEWQRLEREAIPTAIRDGVWHGESILLSRTGARIPVSQVIVAHPSFRTGEPPFFISTVIRDLSERVHAEATLRESERRFRNVLESVRAIAVTLDRTGNVVFANDYLLELTGWTRDEIVGANWFDHFVPDADAAKAAFEQGIASGVTSMHSERVIRTRGGDELVIEWDHTLLRDVSGAVTGTASLGHDVTDRRRAERLKNELISIVSHELRTPIGIVHGALDFLRDQLTLTGQPAEFLAMATRNTDRALLLLNDLLYLDRLESGRRPLERHPLSVAELLSVAYEATQGMAQRNSVTLAVEANGAVSETTVSVDARRMQQLMMNLLSNAVKFSPAGEKVTLSADLPGDETVHVAVRDHGCGIPANMLDRVFDRFVQVHPHDADRRGAGLGLAIAKTIVEKHGGHIWVESDVGRGSTFHFTLPINTDIRG